jgi:hypothetical protein
VLAAAAPGPEPKAVPQSSRAESASPRNPALRDELLRRLQRDQEVRAQWNSGSQNPQTLARVNAIDRENTARMRQIIRVHGWPGRDEVGKDGLQAAFLIVQHADAAPDFQKQCLPLIRKAADRGEVPKEAVAMLTDRVRIAEGNKQLYGTQFTQNAAGEWVPQPIEDAAHVDERRKRIGLPPLAEYARELRAFYGSSAKPPAALGGGGEPR